MEILVFKTNIKSRKALKSLEGVFENSPDISDWSVDTQDVDHVLRVEAGNELPEDEVIRLVKEAGFYCESLPDEVFELPQKQVQTNA